MRKISFSLVSIALFVFLLAACKKDNDTPENMVPAVDAGIYSEITLPDNAAQLKGSASDADGRIVSYLWSQVSGPASSIISDPGSANTEVNELEEGSYLFQLQATDDKGATGVDTVSIKVNPSIIKTVVLQPENNSNEIDLINDNGSSSSCNSCADIPIEAWTRFGNPFTVRAVIKFDLSAIPTGSIIESANLYLSSYPSPTLNGNLTDANFGSDNSMIVQQITSAWAPETIGWYNLPSTTTSNQIIVSKTTQSVLDLDLNVKDMVASMVNTNNYGFYFKLQNEVTYNSRIFVSSKNTSYPDKRPKLVITYK